MSAVSPPGRVSARLPPARTLPISNTEKNTSAGGEGRKDISAWSEMGTCPGNSADVYTLFVPATGRRGLVPRYVSWSENPRQRATSAARASNAAGDFVNRLNPRNTRPPWLCRASTMPLSVLFTHPRSSPRSTSLRPSLGVTRMGDHVGSPASVNTDVAFTRGSKCRNVLSRSSCAATQLILFAFRFSFVVASATMRRSFSVSSKLRLRTFEGTVCMKRFTSTARKATQQAHVFQLKYFVVSRSGACETNKGLGGGRRTSTGASCSRSKKEGIVHRSAPSLEGTSERSSLTESPSTPSLDNRSKRAMSMSCIASWPSFVACDIF
mmetsp:Transcript_37862/g.74859  ORF Transcript_37862/g.74859 Transcript_37862/m.74859 type:complete len:324 (+) Transcript_37862:904-1875(+)